MEKKDESTSCKILSFELGKKIILEREKRKSQNCKTNQHYLGNGQTTIFFDKEAEEEFVISLDNATKKRFGKCESTELSDEKLDSKILCIESQQNIHITAINRNIMKKVLNGIVGFVLIPSVSVLVFEFFIWIITPPSMVSNRGDLYNIILRCPGIFMGLTFGMFYYLLKGEKKKLNSQTTEDPKKVKTLLRNR